MRVSLFDREKAPTQEIREARTGYDRGWNEVLDIYKTAV
jgi:hypothetical protein